MGRSSPWSCWHCSALCSPGHCSWPSLPQGRVSGSSQGNEHKVHTYTILRPKITLKIWKVSSVFGRSWSYQEGRWIMERMMSQRDSTLSTTPRMRDVEERGDGRTQPPSQLNTFHLRAMNYTPNWKKMIMGTFLNSRTATYRSDITEKKITQLMPIYKSWQLGPVLWNSLLLSSGPSDH